MDLHALLSQLYLPWWELVGAVTKAGGRMPSLQHIVLTIPNNHYILWFG